ncbi:MAG: hypothetical protein ACTH2Q_15295 [Propionibacteriaceae bacterium]
MTDGFGWTFGSEWTRDKILADRVAGIESHAAATTSRLRSQLNKVQGNIEKRLDVLTAAFDAYVELGDIREQLLAHADTSGSRRQAGSAFEAMLEGRTATPLDTLDGQYWLPHAVNALIAIVEGGSDPEAEETARRLTPDADRFIVIAAGALGRGETVRGRVADLLVGDRTLTEAQWLIWAAAQEGVYGEVLPSIRDAWAATLDNPDPDDWQEWAADEAGQDPQKQLAWLDTETGARVPEPVDYIGPADAASDAADVAVDGLGSGGSGSLPQSVEALRGTVTEMIEAGIGEEQELLSRARELRARIEDPEGGARREAAQRGPTRSLTTVELDRNEQFEQSAPAIADVVRRTWVGAPAGSPLRNELDSWVRPGLVATAQAITLPSPQPAVIQARSAGGTVDVVAGGPKDPKRVRVATENIERMHARQPWRRFAFAGGAALCLVLAIVTGIAGSTGWTVLFALGAVGLGAAAAWEFAQSSMATRATKEDKAALEQSIATSETEASTQDREAHLALEQARAAQEALVARLADPVAS